MKETSSVARPAARGDGRPGREAMGGEGGEFAPGGGRSGGLGSGTGGRSDFWWDGQRHFWQDRQEATGGRRKAGKLGSTVDGGPGRGLRFGGQSFHCCLSAICVTAGQWCDRVSNFLFVLLHSSRTILNDSKLSRMLSFYIGKS